MASSDDGALSRDYVFMRRSEFCCGADMGAVSAPEHSRGDLFVAALAVSNCLTLDGRSAKACRCVLVLLAQPCGRIRRQFGEPCRIAVIIDISQLDALGR